MKASLHSLVLAGLLAVLTLGCDSNNGPANPSAQSMGELQVAHLSPDAPAVDVWLDGSVVLSAVPFEAFSGYLSVPAGPRQVQVTPAGVSTPIVIDAVVDIAAGTATTVAATGLLTAGDVQPLVLNDDRNAGSQVGVRFVHASPDAPAVDIAVTGGPVLFSNVSFRESQGYIPVAGGTYDLEVRVAGTSMVALALPGVTLTDGTNVSVYAIGQLADSSLDALISVDAP